MSLAQTLKDILKAEDDLLKEHFKRANEASAILADQYVSPAFYQQPNRDGERQSGVVRVDHLLAALHLARARIIFRVMPDFWQRAILKLITYLEQFLNRLAVSKFLKAVPRANILIEFLTSSLRAFELGIIQRNLESEIRKAVGGVRKELNGLMLKQARDKRPVGDVHTRHYRPQKKRKMAGCKSQ